MSEDEEVNLRLKVRDAMQFAAQLRSAAREIEGLGTNTRKTKTETERGARGWLSWGSALKVATSTAAALGLANIAQTVGRVVSNVITGGVQFNIFRENSQIAFTTLLGSAGAARRMLAGLFDLAAHSPFRFQNITEAAQTLLAYGFRAESLLGTLRTMSNIIAANPTLGSDAAQRLAIALGQIQSTGRLMGQDALQLVPFGINAYRIIADKLHITQVEARKRGEQGLLDGTMAVNAILEFANRKYRGLSTRLATSTGGLISTLQDLWQQAEGRITEPLMPGLRRNVARINAFLASPEFLRGLKQFNSIVGTIVDDLKPAIGGTLLFGATIARYLGPPTARLVAALEPEFRLLSEIIGGTGVVLSTVLGPALRVVGNVVDNAADAVTGFNEIMGRLAKRLGGSVQAALDDVRGVWKWLKDNARVVLHVDLSFPGSSKLSALGRLAGVPSAVVEGVGGAQIPGLGVTPRQIQQAAGLGSRPEPARVGHQAGGDEGGQGGRPVPRAFSFPPIVIPVEIDGRQVGQAVSEDWHRQFGLGGP